MWSVSTVMNTEDVSNVCRSGNLVVYAQVQCYVHYTYEKPNIHVNTSKGATYGHIYLCQIHSKKLKAASHWLIQFVLNILCNFSQKQLEVGWNINTCPKIITNMNLLLAIIQQEVCFQTLALTFYCIKVALQAHMLTLSKFKFKMMTHLFSCASLKPKLFKRAS